MGDVKKMDCIQPVWGVTNRNLSYGVLDTAETLVGNIDELSNVIDDLTDKYEQEAELLFKEENSDDDDEDCGITVLPAHGKPDDNHNTQERVDLSMFKKLKTCLDSARHLIGTLRREKGRLMKREMSVECRMSEIEDYKKHMKQDLSSLNDFVEVLSGRICQLESKLVDEQERFETLHAEHEQLKDKWQRAEALCNDLNDDSDSLQKEIKSLKMERTDNTYKMDMLIEESRKLKELVRQQSENDSGCSLSWSVNEKQNGDSDSVSSCDLGVSSLPSSASDCSVTVNDRNGNK